MKNMKNGALLLEMRFAYSKELKKRTGLDFPNLEQIAIKKEQDKFYYTAHNAQKDWVLLK